MLFTEGPSYTYLEQTEKIFEERGQVLPEEERARLMEMDASMNAQMRRERRMWAPVLMLFGLAVYGGVRRDGSASGAYGA